MLAIFALYFSTNLFLSDCFLTNNGANFMGKYNITDTVHLRFTVPSSNAAFLTSASTFTSLFKITHYN